MMDADPEIEFYVSFTIAFREFPRPVVNRLLKRCVSFPAFAARLLPCSNECRRPVASSGFISVPLWS